MNGQMDGHTDMDSHMENGWNAGWINGWDNKYWVLHPFQQYFEVKTFLTVIHSFRDNSEFSKCHWFILVCSSLCWVFLQCKTEWSAWCTPFKFGF